MFHGESLPCRSESSTSFTASLFLAGRSRLVSRRVPALQVGIVQVFHGKSLSHRWESSRCFTASLSLADRNRLSVSLRLSPSQVGLV